MVGQYCWMTSLCVGMRIVGPEARLSQYITRLGENHRRGPLVCIDWARLVGEARLVMIEWVKPDGNQIEQGIGSRLEWDDSVVSGWYLCDGQAWVALISQIFFS